MARMLFAEAEEIDRFNEAHEAALRELRERCPQIYLNCLVLALLSLAVVNIGVLSLIWNYAPDKGEYLTNIEPVILFNVYVLLSFGGCFYALVVVIRVSARTVIYERHLQPLVNDIVGEGVKWYYVGTNENPSARGRKTLQLAALQDYSLHN